jgi:hypothetical protein
VVEFEFEHALRQPGPAPPHRAVVRREGVTQSALGLQKAGLIRYSRGHTSVLYRAGLERSTCECYAVVKHECDRLLPEKRAT